MGVFDISIVMAGLVPAIHVLATEMKGVDARDKPGHDEFVEATGSLSSREPVAGSRICYCPAASRIRQRF
jgi:hypothetical protein